MNSFKKNIYRTAIEDSCVDCIAHDVVIGTQTWTGCNADISTYRDLTVIPQVSDPTDWENLTTGAWCYYNNDPTNDTIYGKLYNWYAIAGVYDAASLADPLLRKQFAPVGWHIPIINEFDVLITYLGGSSIAGGKLKEEGFCHWLSPNTGATNNSGFTGLPGGNRDEFGIYNNIGNVGTYWSSTEYLTNIYVIGLYRLLASTNRGQSLLNRGFAVRFIEGEVAQCPTCTDEIVNIGSQTWTTCNLNTEYYSNGEVIPYEPDPTAWSLLTTGAWCHVDGNPANDAIYGKLYNWYAVNDSRGIAPSGYIVPTDTDWNNLSITYGGLSVVGGKMKETGFTHWNSPNTGATNSTCFTGLPSGYRNGTDGTFIGIGDRGDWWTSTSGNIANAYSYLLQTGGGTLGRNLLSKTNGYSVRLLKL